MFCPHSAPSAPAFPRIFATNIVNCFVSAFALIFVPFGSFNGLPTIRRTWHSVDSNVWCCARVFHALSAGWRRLCSTPAAAPARSAPAAAAAFASSPPPLSAAMIAHTVCVSTSSIVSNTPASKNASTFWSSKNHATSPAGRFKIFSRCADSHAPTAFTASTRALTGSEGDFAVRSHLASPVGPAFAFGSAGASGVLQLLRDLGVGPARGVLQRELERLHRAVVVVVRLERAPAPEVAFFPLRSELHAHVRVRQRLLHLRGGREGRTTARVRKKARARAGERERVDRGHPRSADAPC
eukprot:31017-Pelagococcus_subviridis.AAC.16